MKNLITYLVLLFLLIFGRPLTSNGQGVPVFGTVEGQTNILDFPETHDITFSISATCISELSPVYFLPDIEIYCCPTGDYIESASYCKINQQNVFYLRLRSGNTVMFNATNHVTKTTSAKPNLNGQPQMEIKGDDAYIISYGMVNKSSDQLSTWVMDTMGLHGAFNRSICVDTFQNVYLATSNGLYSQTQTGTTWTKKPNLPGTNGADLVFTDRSNRMFVLIPGPKFYKSSDLGNSFQIDSAGISNQKVISVGDDVFGNVYVITNPQGYNTGERIYRSLGGTQPFTRIDGPLTSLNLDAPSIDPYLAISGDSVLFVATRYGRFRSHDMGNTWIETNKGNGVQSFSGMAKANNGKMLVTTPQGCFRSTNAMDTSWTKIYPVNGFAGNQPLYKDNSGTLYTRGTILFNGLNNPVRMVVKSTDNGDNWSADTAGISKVGMDTWFVDENGTQHAAVFGGGSAPISLFRKTIGNPWVKDTVGYSSTNTAQPIVFGSNGNGIIYFSDYGSLLWSKQGAGNWMVDSIGLGTSNDVFDFAHTSANKMYLGTYNGLFKQNGTGGWSKIITPSGMSAFAIAVDASNTLWAAFSYFDINFNSVGSGIYYTSDEGAHWKQPAGQIDTITFTKLIAAGDSVYGLSYYNGAYLFTKSGGAGVQQSEVKNNSFQLFPDPTTAQIHVSLPVAVNYTIGVFDISGKEILSFNTSKTENNIETINWESGIYFIDIRSENFHGVKKFVKE